MRVYHLQLIAGYRAVDPILEPFRRMRPVISMGVAGSRDADATVKHRNLTMRTHNQLGWGRRGSDSYGGSEGSAVERVMFRVRTSEMSPLMQRLEQTTSSKVGNRPFGRLPNSTTAIAFLTDPWGTYIELTENLAPAK